MQRKSINDSNKAETLTCGAEYKHFSPVFPEKIPEKIILKSSLKIIQIIKIMKKITLLFCKGKLTLWGDQPLHF